MCEAYWLGEVRLVCAIWGRSRIFWADWLSRSVERLDRRRYRIEVAHEEFSYFNLVFGGNY